MLKQMELKFWLSFATSMGTSAVAASQRCKLVSLESKGSQAVVFVFFHLDRILSSFRKLPGETR